MTETSLGAEAQQLGVMPRAIDWAEFWLRVCVSIVVLAIFAFANTKVIELVTTFANADFVQISSKTISPPDRLINDKVILALIAGTVAQVITVLLGITRYLFPTPK